MYNLSEWSDNYSKTSASLWQYYKDGSNNNLIDSKSFEFKSKFTNNTNDLGNSRVYHRFWEHGGGGRGLFKIWWEELESTYGGTWGLKTMVKNTCERVHL